jgi:hypothetical protein
LAKATDLYNNWDKSFRHQDVRSVDINRCIFDADNMAHRFHAMRGAADKNILPDSVVAPKRRDLTPGRSLSELMRELRREHLTPLERLAEFEIAAYRDAVQGLAETYARITGDPKAAALIHDYLRRQEPRLDREAIDAMREALQVAATSTREYPALPDAVRNRCLEMCFALLDEHGDSRLIGILDAAEGRGVVGLETIYDRYPGLTRPDGDDHARVEDPELDLDVDLDEERGPRRTR